MAQPLLERLSNVNITTAARGKHPFDKKINELGYMVDIRGAASALKKVTSFLLNSVQLNLSTFFQSFFFLLSKLT